MKLSEIKAGSEIFVDSNIFIYHFTGVSDECMVNDSVIIASMKKEGVKLLATTARILITTKKQKPV